MAGGKFIKKLWKASAWTVSGLLVLGLLLFLLIQSYTFQTWLTGQMGSWLERESGGKISVGTVEVDFFNRLKFREVLVLDLKNDTLLYAEELGAVISGFDRTKQKMNIEKVSLSHATVGIARYADDSVMNFQFLADAFATTDTTDTHSASWDITYGDLILEKIHFTYKDHHDTSTTRGLNFSDMSFSDVSALITEISLEEDTVSLRLAKLEGKEKCGMIIRQFTSQFSIAPDKMKFTGLLLALNQSVISTNLSLRYKNYEAFDAFMEKVKIRAELKDVRLWVSDLGYFVPDLIGFDRSASFSGKISGPLSDLKARDMDLKFGDHTHFAGDFEMTGLPNLEETYIHLDIADLTTSKQDIERIPLAPYDQGKNMELSPNMAYLGKVKYKGRISGYYYDLVSHGNITTALGNVYTDLKLRQDPVTGLVSYKGRLGSQGFDIGKLLHSSESMGSISMDLVVDGQGIKLKEIKADIEGKIHSLVVNNYAYKNLDVKGSLAKRVFNGRMSVDDPNIHFGFEGTADFGKSPMTMDFNATVDRANLDTLNLYKTSPALVVGMDLEILMALNNLDDAKGNIKLKNIHYTQGTESFELKDFLLRAYEEGGKRSLKIISDMMDVHITGKYRLQELGGSFFDVMSLYVTSLLPRDYLKSKSVKKQKVREEFEYLVVFKNTKPVTRLFMPDLNIAHATTLKGKYNSKRGYFDMQGKSGSIGFAGTEMKGWKLEAQTGDESFDLVSYADVWKIRDTLRMDGMRFTTRLFNDTVLIGIDWRNKTKKANRGDLKLLVNMVEYPKIIGSLLPTDSSLVVEDSLWKISGTNRMVMDSGKIIIDDLVFAHDKQEVKIHGSISRNKEDQLLVEFRDFNLGNLNALTHGAGIGLKGTITGGSTLSNLYNPSQLIFSSGFDFKKMWINKEEIGTGSVISIYDKQKDVISLSGSFSKYNNDQKNFTFSGKYFPGKTKDNINMDVGITNFGLVFFEPFLKSVFSRFRGYASGKVNIAGELNNPKITGFAVLQMKNLQMDYLNPNNSYSFTDSIYLEPGSIRFDSLLINDYYGQTAIVNGRIFHENYSNFQLDIDIWANKFMAMNTTEAQNALYYGKAFVTGRVNVFGFVDQTLQIDAALKTEKSMNPRNKKLDYTQFFIPLSGPSEVSESTFISFIDKDSISFKKNQQKVDLSGFTLNLDLEITPDAECQILFDPKVGDIIKGRGDGNLRMEINSLGNFAMFGDYNITEGEYLFTLQNIINKKFRVEKGSTIQWTGDPYNAEINLKALYEVRTSLQVMFPEDSSGVYKRRYPVNCVLNMTKNLLTPDISFDVDLPSVDASVLQTVKGYMNTEMEMNRQVFSLLVLNTFVTPQSLVGFSDINANANVASVTGFEMLSNQLSNILSGVSTEFDLRVNYRPGDDISSDQLEVALSKHLLNDRLIIDGSVANNSTQGNTNAIVGEINAEYKITDDGKVRVKAFNKANDNTVVNTEAPYTQGIGIFYREDFETIGDLYRRYTEKLKRNKKAT
ncbi:MAG: translocation/assembly module TamB [Bacteroidia bacterium]|nr:translocation/assembly module TamB [Bacteroidia bacterium]